MSPRMRDFTLTPYGDDLIAAHRMASSSEKRLFGRL